MAKKTGEGFNFSENYLSLGLGILVVVVIGALIFNYVSNRQGKQGETTSSAEEQAAQEQKEVSLPTTYKVASGDDLWKISEKFYKTGYNWVDIAQANNLENPNILLADTELTIPEVEPKVLAVAEETTQPTVEVSNAPGAITSDSYTIVKGDDLWNIAIRAYGDGYKWVEIAKANELVNPDIIHAGNVLKLPR